ncbi:MULTISPECIES: adenosine deaminase [Marinomonas]|uniref:Adenine deaminase n=1 Tax=Marinomonas arctica TaxID=383750 RepID=A0A7H1JAX0_9GAMM|nr:MULTISPECIES: adenosine deaminase [Marinomonas]MCS7486856.1 adenine deaminase [Marinomonas sp. BSi20414]QNT07636.1 adenosine deaminase [Marinomonas arctica]GGN21433.1 adenine deaminase [Marinomonas arctica]
METLIELSKKMPKTELHLHIEGTFEPEQMFAIAQRNQVELKYHTVEALKAAYQFTNLQDFLDLYYQGMSVLLHEADFYDLTMAYLSKVHSENVVHVEIFFDPQGHLSRGVPFDTQINGIYNALKDAETKWGMTFKLIMSFLRHLSEESAFETLELSKPFLPLIDGVGLDSSEVGHPPEKFLRVFEACKDLGLKVTAHAGEEGPPEYVWQAIDQIGVDRIDHGNRALEDDQLIEEIKKRGLTLTVCPLSNLKLCVVNDMKDHPIKTMLKRGLNATVNSDDPAYFGGYMADNYASLITHTGISKEELLQLAQNGITGSWMENNLKEKHLAQLRTLFA